MVDLLGHPVVHQRRELALLLLVQRGGALLHADAVAPRRLEALDERLRGGRVPRVLSLFAPKAGRGADGDGVGRPGRRVGEARPDLDDHVAVVVVIGGVLEQERKEKRRILRREVFFL